MISCKEQGVTASVSFPAFGCSYSGRRRGDSRYRGQSILVRVLFGGEVRLGDPGEWYEVGAREKSSRPWAGGFGGTHPRVARLVVEYEGFGSIPWMA